ncbi:UDP-N-acetylmuramate dehydrogenase [Thiomicrorhabdus cannonii]|uniref:UDP-N-acetylmuramate dehydrogenase n=1 Tax=Thiomicrorhabdus cannonii TaxID=2748011 RepID=UPI0015BA1BB4|nr:UDP-N-acetylmuramate dehydrogenase [Thiomicrorhabdus cannonii]
MHIQANYSLKKHNTFKIDVKTQYYVEINRQSDITTLRSDLTLASLPWRIIGGGSNILFTHDIEGVMVHCGYKQLKIVKQDEDSVWLSVGAGMNWHDLVTYTVEHNWWGLENLALIPGTVGAAPVQNVGAYGAEARDAITRVQTLNLYSGHRQEFRNSECNFGYRTSIFKQEYADKILVHRVTFRLRKLHAGHPNLVYEPLKEALSEIPKTELTPKIIYDTVIKLRKERIPDPNVFGNAGSFFKNPVVGQSYFEELLTRYPDVPHHKTLEGFYKIPAAWLIEQVNWKGQRCGAAGVSDKHALVLENRGGAKGQDIVELSQMVQEAVDHKFGIHLEPEVIII